ncbi:hypothetical protein [Gordonia paraffinivorans]|uniref:hypothetical protein n=1 Tax=Gordonia paraffinivorans TaxID=175628 RepID=UPI0014473059|nr:hypothetical protein [Gordonia paraffinivorans]
MRRDHVQDVLGALRHRHLAGLASAAALDDDEPTFARIDARMFVHPLLAQRRSSAASSKEIAGSSGKRCAT